MAKITHSLSLANWVIFVFFVALPAQSLALGIFGGNAYADHSHGPPKAADFSDLPPMRASASRRVLVLKP